VEVAPTVVVGQVAELWRYPVKSMRGERRPHVSVIPVYGIPGDRGWAIRDEKVGEIRGARNIRPLLHCSARYVSEPEGASTPTVEVTLPDGSTVTTDDPGIAGAISDAVGRPVTVWPRRSADDPEHLRRREVISEAEAREQLGLLADEPMPDYAALPPDMLEIYSAYVSPIGVYFDTFPLSLLTSTSMSALGALAPDSVIDSRRFRQNVIVTGAPELAGFAEFDWVGRQLRIGSVIVKVMMPISRCSVVTLPQAELQHDRSLMRTLVRETHMNLGVYLSVVQGGAIAEGDDVTLLD
jgi:uncharacterized protein YcbX